MPSTRVALKPFCRLLALLFLLHLAPPAYGVFVQLDVDETADLVDKNPGDGSCETYFTTCSLRAAIQESNASGDIDRINVPAGTFRLLLPGAGEDAAMTGDLDITETVEIAGAGPDQTIIDGNGLDRVFEIHDLAYVPINGLTIRGGLASGSTDPEYFGGGIHVRDATLNLDDCVLDGNAANAGGGLYAAAGSSVTITDCAIQNNEARNLGNVFAQAGGIFSRAGTLTLDRVEMSRNRSLVEPAGFYGLYGVAFTIRNSTISGNAGSGIEIGSSPLEIVNTTIFDNTADGLHTHSTNGSEPLTVRNSIIANNQGNDCAITGTQPASLTFVGEFNLDSDGTCPLDMSVVDLPSTNPMLGPLGLHGGLTQTHVPLPGSPVIDTANHFICPTPDQRGAPRHSTAGHRVSSTATWVPSRSCRAIRPTTPMKYFPTRKPALRASLSPAIPSPTATSFACCTAASSPGELATP